MDLYAKKFTDLDDGEKQALAFSLQTLRSGDILWHDTPSIWTWALNFISVVLEEESKTHPRVNMYIEFSKVQDKYGIGIIQTDIVSMTH